MAQVGQGRFGFIGDVNSWGGGYEVETTILVMSGIDLGYQSASKEGSVCSKCRNSQKRSKRRVWRYVLRESGWKWEVMEETYDDMDGTDTDHDGEQEYRDEEGREGQPEPPNAGPSNLVSRPTMPPPKKQKLRR
jgi:hypothetical protein